MIKIALGIFFGCWLTIGSFAIADKIASRRMERKLEKQRKMNKEN